MTILQKPPQSSDRQAGKGWHKFRHAGGAVRRTDAWEHETFAEEQARWERSDPEYARICEEVRQAKKRGEEASRRADQTKAEWDARVAAQRQANDDAQRADHALRADYLASRQTAASRVRVLRARLDIQRRAADCVEGDPPGALAPRQDARQAQSPTPAAGNAPATTQARLDAERWVDEGGSLDAEARRRRLPRSRRSSRDVATSAPGGRRPNAAVRETGDGVADTTGAALESGSAPGSG